MLTDILPDRARRTAYVIYAVGAVVLGVLGIVLPAYGLTPVEYEVATDVWLYLGVAVGAVAASNISEPRHRADT